jgi:uncharacterized membrane protein
VINVDRRLAHSKERAMRKEKVTADRLGAFSDGIFAVALTVMVLELKAPEQSAFSAVWALWPTGISYAVSFLFIAIIWINHHYLMRFVGPPTLRLIWMNFIHLFLVLLLPFATAWVARTRLASSPVVFYAGLFVCIDIAYNVFEREVFAGAAADQVSKRTRRIARRRSLVVLVIFTAAMLTAFVAPRVGFGLVCGALILHLLPDPLAVAGDGP